MKRTSHPQALMGIFTYLDDLLASIEALKARRLTIRTVYSPARNHEIIGALGLKPSPVRYWTLAGGVLGIGFGFWLSMYTAMQWRFIVWGKPPVPFVPYVIEAFEFCILISVFLNLFGIMANTRLPRIQVPDHYDPRFSVDRYGVVVECAEAERDAVRGLLRKNGAEEVHDV